MYNLRDFCTILGLLFAASTAASADVNLWESGAGLRLLLHRHEKSPAENDTFLSHDLRLQFPGGQITFARNEAGSDLVVGFKIIQDTTASNETVTMEGRGNKAVRTLLPLLLGFKSAGTLIAVLLGIFLLNLKALAIGKLALVISLGVAIKKLLEHKPKKDYGFDFIPFGLYQPEIYHGGPYDSVGPFTEPLSPYHEPLEGQDDIVSPDLAGHFSNLVAVSKSGNSSDVATGPKSTYRRNQIRKRPTKPVVTLHKITTYQN